MEIEKIREWVDSKYRKEIKCVHLWINNGGDLVGSMFVSEENLKGNISIKFEEISGKINIWLCDLRLELFPENISLSYTKFSKLLSISIEFDLREFNKKVMSGYFDGE